MVGAGTALVASSLRAIGARAAIDSTPIRFGAQTTIWGAAALIAEDTGLWSKYGAKVQSIRVATGTVNRDGLISGSLDAATLGATPFALAASHADLQAIAINAYTGGTLSVVVGKNSKYKTVADLKGAKIGTNLGSSTNEIFVDKIAPKFGLAETDYHLINMSFQDMVGALETKGIDAFLGVEPFPSLAIYNGFGRVLTTYAKYDYSPDFIVFRGSFIKDHRDDVVAALRGWLAVLQLYRHRAAYCDQLLYEDFKKHGASMPPAVLKLAMANMEFNPNYRPDIHAYMHAQAEILMKRNAISVEPDWNKVLRTDILAEAQRA